jgi:hypothetical protein
MSKPSIERVPWFGTTWYTHSLSYWPRRVMWTLTTGAFCVGLGAAGVAMAIGPRPLSWLSVALLVLHFIVDVTLCVALTVRARRAIRVSTVKPFRRNVVSARWGIALVFILSLVFLRHVKPLEPAVLYVATLVSVGPCLACFLDSFRRVTLIERGARARLDWVERLRTEAAQRKGQALSEVAHEVLETIR